MHAQGQGTDCQAEMCTYLDALRARSTGLGSLRMLRVLGKALCVVSVYHKRS